MDPEELRKSLLADNAEPEPSDEGDEFFDETGDLPHLMKSMAGRLQSAFSMTTDSAERRRIRERYSKLDAWLLEHARLNSSDSPDAPAQRDAFRAMVLDEMRKWRAGGAEYRAREREIEVGHKQSQEKAKAGAGAATGKRIKDEIEYLLKNFSPSNEQKIEALIDKWRTSGDPNYDPGIKMRLRNARRKKNSQDYAL
jgi:hypothetical protein